LDHDLFFDDLSPESGEAKSIAEGVAERSAQAAAAAVVVEVVGVVSGIVKLTSQCLQGLLVGFVEVAAAFEGQALWIDQLMIGVKLLDRCSVVVVEEGVDKLAPPREVEIQATNSIWQ
jgi:hypothetical protein